jgi:hypothetical protein
MLQTRIDRVLGDKIGWFHVKFYTSILSAFATSGFMFFILQYLELMPVYECRVPGTKVWTRCQPATTFCVDDAIEYQIDF